MLAARVLSALAFLGLTAAAPPRLSSRQSTAITALSAAQISSFTPYINYAAAGYCKPASTKAWNCGANCNANAGFQTVASGGDGSAVQYWYVGYDANLNTIIVTHQGTDPTKFLADETDVDFFLQHMNTTLFPGLSSSIEVHSGFADEHALTAPSILAAVQAAVAKWPSVKSVTLVGHSLGGALALLDFAYLPLHLPSLQYKGIMFGMPRVGNQAWADYISQGSLITHVNNKLDIVPIVPGRGLGFHHPTGEVHIQDDSASEWLACPGQDNTSGKCTTGAVPTIFDGSIINHLGPYNGIWMGSC
ncbi:lipase class 3 family protein [Roridomyces roridus]|uniref:Lipase class 3 family protein n=1 Tax=Roridomyces roridus TaxID=1738132 RepID=A0AAD7C5J5_9AGAR|nr:lipase class 3 family protein [Roridomyces roridus]